MKNKHFKVVIFDLDGTLVDAYPAIVDSVNHMLKVLGRPERSARIIKRSVGWGVDALIGRFVEAEQVPEGLAIFRAHHEQRLIERVRLLPGAKTLLPFLKKQGCVLAIASNRPTNFCDIILKALGIDTLFDEVLGADAVARPKPHPDILKEVLQRTKIQAAEALFVGDMSVDVLCGQRAGVLVAAVPTGSCTLAEIKAASPDYMLARISDVRALFTS